MENIKLNYQTNKIFVVISFDNKKDFKESYLYTFNIDDYYNKFRDNGKLDIFKLKTYLINHRRTVNTYPYTMDEMYNMSTIALATMMSYDVQST